MTTPDLTLDLLKDNVRYWQSSVQYARDHALSTTERRELLVKAEWRLWVYTAGPNRD